MLADVACIWSWRLFGINPAVLPSPESSYLKMGLTCFSEIFLFAHMATRWQPINHNHNRGTPALCWRIAWCQGNGVKPHRRECLTLLWSRRTWRFCAQWTESLCSAVEFQITYLDLSTCHIASGFRCKWCKQFLRYDILKFEACLLECETDYYDRYLHTFPRKRLPPSSGYKSLHFHQTTRRHIPEDITLRLTIC